MKRLPEPDLSQKMSGLLRPKWLAITELLVGFGPLPSSYGLVETTTPPETGVGPEGTLPERWLALTSISFVLKSAMPIPEKFLSNFAARHERVLFSTVLPFTSKPTTGSSNPNDSKNMPAQLLRIVFPAKVPPLASWRRMPHAPPEMRLPTTLPALLARSGPKMAMPASPGRRMSLETILVPVEPRISMPDAVLSVMSLERNLVPVESMRITPNESSLRSFPATVVRELASTLMPSASVLGLPITWLFAIVVLTLRPKATPLATLPVIRFPTTEALRAAKTSITNAPLSLKPRNVKPETLTSLTRGPVSSPVSGLKSPTTQIATSTPPYFEQGEPALAGASITASPSPRSLIPFLVIITSSR